MSRLTHEQLCAVMGFSGLLDDPSWVPVEQPVQALLYTAIRNECVDAADALAIVKALPHRVRQILPLLGDDDIESISARAAAIPPMTDALAETVDVMRAWTARQAAYRTLSRRGIGG